MKKFLIIPLILFSHFIQADVLWKPEAISYELKQAHALMGTGLMLELNQVLEPGESGWKQSRIDVPESWSGARLEMIQGTIYITTGPQIYYLNSRNIGELSFAILNGGHKTDARLQEIWSKYARSE